MPTISTNQDYRHAAQNNEYWKFREQKRNQPFMQQVQEVARQPGLHSGNRDRQAFAHAAVHLLTLLTCVKGNPAITPGRAKEISEENRNLEASRRYDQYTKMRAGEALHRYFWKKKGGGFSDAMRKDKNSNADIDSGRHDLYDSTDTNSNYNSLSLKSESQNDKPTDLKPNPSYFNFISGVNAGVIKPLEKKNSLDNFPFSKVVFDENEKINVLNELKERLTISNFLADDDKNNFEFITRTISANHPVVRSVFKIPKESNADVGDFNAVGGKKKFIDVTVDETGKK
ncbi:hypothetical protein ACFFJN_11110 [Erwinia mallotivora]|uniref:hypothetical protein n=1 Tax=Erwinia mallotivora TaxID=69222 RepID=UPI0035E54A1A